MIQREPLKTGFQVTELDGVPSDLPVKLRFPDGALSISWDNNMDVSYINVLNSVYIRLDGTSTTTAQIPFAVGLKSNDNIILKSGKKLIFDGA